MFKSSLLLSLALGGLVLAGCNKDETTPPPATVPATLPVVPGTSLPNIVVPPVTLPTTDTFKGAASDLKDKATDIKDGLIGAAKSTTQPSENK